MKKYIYNLALLCLLTSCSDVLDTEPTDFYTSENYWKTEKHALEALTGCYAALTHDDLYNGYTAFMFECMTPNAYHKDNYKSTGDFARGTHNGTTEGMALSMWNGAYRGIGRVNTLLDHIHQIPMSEDLKKRVIAEAKFLRAFYYSKINILFNGVPLVLTADVEENKKKPRSTFLEVYNQILLDLDEASKDLPVVYDKSNGGRATKGAALALKARVMLQNKDYEGTITAIERVLEEGKYSLFTDYNGLFRKVNEGNTEIIFDVRFKAPEVVNDYDIIHAQFNVQAPTQGLVDLYEMKDGKDKKDSDLYNPNEPYENRDPRLKQSILHIGAPWRKRTASDVDLHQTGYAFIKYTEYNADTEGTLTNTDVNYIEIRFADLLLMYAEALNEVQGPVDKVYEAINKIRTRPSVNLPELVQGLTQDEMRKKIRKERRIELAGEGSYFYDIRRWQTIDEDMNASVYDYKGNVKETRVFNPARDYYWPIPYTQIDLNGALKQNPGY